MRIRSRLGMAAAVGAAADVLLFALLRRFGAPLFTAQTCGFALGIVAMDILVARRVPTNAAAWRRAVLLALLAFFPRCGIFQTLVAEAGWWPMAGAMAAAATAAATNGVGLILFAFSRRDPMNDWPRFAAFAVGYSILLRLAFAGAVDLIPEEAYYWTYAQHLDLGYLDHPPMVAWLVWLGAALFGDTEIGVRAPALACWAVTAVLVFRLTVDLVGR